MKKIGILLSASALLLCGGAALPHNPFLPSCRAEAEGKISDQKGRLPMKNAFKPVRSPNGKIIWRPVAEDGAIQSFEVLCKSEDGSKKAIEVVSFGQLMKDGRGKNPTLKSVSAPRAVKDRYKMISGKRSKCANDAREVVYFFNDESGRELRLVVRVYNDGVAFRYEMPDLKPTQLGEEQTVYRIPEGVNRWFQKWSSGYEDFYPLSTTGEASNRRWGYPALLQPADDVWVLITEGGIERMHSASSLWNDREITDYRVAPDENRKELSGDWFSPWRVLIIGTKQDVVESTLMNDVSAPNRLSDTSWIKPGSASWIYWAYNRGSKDYKIVKQYIDMAHELKLPYVLIDWEWDIMANGGNIDDALRYAKEKGVRVLLWYNSSTAYMPGGTGQLYRLNKPENREKEFAWLAEKGVAGVKIDFFDGDKQSMMEYCIDLLECAAKHKILVNFHGATIPRGWVRTYPNLMSVEAVYGAEWYNNRPILTDRAAAHNVTLCFTRGVVGPMDYTPCTFSDSQHRHITTHAHELALPVLFESALTHWADRPQSYLAQPDEVKDFISALPTAWDDTKLLSGYPGEDVVMARRKGDVCYVAGLNGTNEPRTVSVDWGFLGKGKPRSIQIFEDGESKEDPWKITNPKSLPKKFELKPRGGFIVVVKK